MKISPVAGPGAIPQNGTPESVRTAKAVAAFNKGASSYDKAPIESTAQEHPVQNPNQVSPEELSAIQATQPIENTDNITPVETPVEETPQAKPPEETALSRQYAQLARQERALRAKVQQQEQAIKAREAAIAEREAAIAAKSQEYQTGYIPLERVKQDALSVLAEAGVSYEGLTQQILSQQPVDPRTQATISRLEAKLAALEQAAEASKVSQTEQAKNSYQSALRQIEMDTTQLVKNDPVTYEAISKMGKPAIKEVTKLIEETYAKDGILMSTEEAAQEVENYLVEENYRMASSITKIKERMAKASATQKPSTQQTPAQKPQTQPQMKTLTNATASTRKLSARERALLAFKGELK